MLKSGDRGTAVKNWQAFLLKHGFNPGHADGIFGPKTKSATIAFQQKPHLQPDGIVGPKTAGVARVFGYGQGDQPGPVPTGDSPQVIDISHHNGMVDFAKLKNAGVIGVIARATIGETGKDRLYSENRRGAKANGLLFGAYHFGTKVPVEGQIRNFFSVVGRDSDILLALDWERWIDKKEHPEVNHTMSTAKAVEFVDQFRRIRGQNPVLYSNLSFFNENQASAHPSLTSCPLWLALYSASLRLPKGWTDYFLWQYSKSGKFPWSGEKKFDFDRSSLDPTALKKRWEELSRHS